VDGGVGKGSSDAHGVMVEFLNFENFPRRPPGAKHAWRGSRQHAGAHGKVPSTVNRRRMWV